MSGKYQSLAIICSPASTFTEIFILVFTLNIMEDETKVKQNKLIYKLKVIPSNIQHQIHVWTYLRKSLTVPLLVDSINKKKC